MKNCDHKGCDTAATWKLEPVTKLAELAVCDDHLVTMARDLDNVQNTKSTHRVTALLLRNRD